jgi:hypothetical protein
LSVSSNRRAGGTLPNNSRSSDRGAGGAVERETELRLEARGAQHAHRVFAVTRDRVADELQAARGDVFDTAGVIPDREVGDVVVQRVRGEVAAPHVVVDVAVDVVAQDAAVFVGDAVLVVIVVAGAGMARAIALHQRRYAVEAVPMRTGFGQHRGFIRIVEILVLEFLVEIVRLLVVVQVRTTTSGGSSAALIARNVATSMISRPKNTCARRKRRPMSRQLRKVRLTSSGSALVAMSKSFGVMPISRSRTQPPTRKAS